MNLRRLDRIEGILLFGRPCSTELQELQQLIQKEEYSLLDVRMAKRLAEGRQYPYHPSKKICLIARVMWRVANSKEIL